MKATIRKATLIRDGQKCVIFNEYDKGEHLTIIQDEVPEDVTKQTVLCINKYKLVQIVHKHDLFFRKDMYETAEVDENGIVDYDLDVDDFRLMYSSKRGVYIHETNNY